LARKKATEPQDGLEQEPIVPAEDMTAGEGAPELVGDAPEGAAPPDSGGGDILADFPVEDGNPFMVGGDAPAPSDGDPDAAPAAGSGEEDYAAILQAVKDGGGVMPVPPDRDAPLLLDSAENGDDDGDVPTSLVDEAPGNGPVPGDSAAIEEHGRRPVPRRERERVLTIDPRAEVQTQEDLEDIVWHELQNANRTRHPLTGQLGNVGRTDNGMDVAVVLYKGIQVLIPLKEMMVHTGPVPSGGAEFRLWVDAVTRALNARLGSDIDFVVRGIDEDGRKVVASRRDAMLRKRKRFYLETDELGRHMIEEGRIVQARVVAVAEKLVRLEVFGVECNVAPRGAAWLWADDIRETHYVGELIPVRVVKIERPSVDRMKIQVDPRDVFGEEGDNLSQCQTQCRYVGRVTAVRRGRIFIRLNIGVRAVAHVCMDMRMPGKKDTVAVHVVRLDEKNGAAIGIITRIIKQNL
jgi:hypothetical protein